VYPILFQISGFSISSLAVLVTLGFFIAFFIVWRRLRELGTDEEKIIDAFLFSSLLGLISSRLLYIGLNYSVFGFNLIKWFYLQRFPGFSLWGALFGFLFGFYRFCQKERWNFLKVADELIFALCPFLILISLGSFLDGSNLGAETGMFWGIFFPADPVRRHPIALFQALLFFLLWLIFLKIERIWRSWSWYKSKKQGLLFLIFLIFSSLSQLSLAFLKPMGLYLVNSEKIASFLILVISLVFLYWFSGRKVKEDFMQFKEKIAIKKRENGKSDKKN